MNTPSIDELLKKIRATFPEVTFSAARMLTHGWDDVVVILDDQIVFTFPREQKGSVEQFQKELTLLPLLKKYLTLPVPDFAYISPDKSFAGYPYIPGEPLTPEILRALSIEEQRTLAAEVGRFLKELHSFPIDQALKCGVEEARSMKETNAWLKAGAETMKKAASTEEEADKIDQLIAELMKREETDDRALVHNDLSTDHILFDRKQKTLSGIIDFGDAAINDPAIDFSKFWDLGEDFVNAALEACGATDPNFKARARTHYIQYSLGNLYWGIKNSNDVYLSRGRRIFSHPL